MHGPGHAGLERISNLRDRLAGVAPKALSTVHDLADPGLVHLLEPLALLDELAEQLATLFASQRERPEPGKPDVVSGFLHPR
jgi:hypothetical protein